MRKFRLVMSVAWLALGTLIMFLNGDVAAGVGCFIMSRLQELGDD